MSDHSGGDGAYARSATRYLAHGWQPVPLNSGKGVVLAGFTGYDAQRVTSEHVRAWCDAYPDSGVALHLTTEISLDVDNYENLKRNLKQGDAAENLRQLEADLGPLPPTVMVSSRLRDEDYDESSGIRIYRIPEAYLNLIRQPVWKSEAGPGIDVIRFGHRQVVVWPSRHATRKSVYAVLDQRTGEIYEGPLPPPDSLPMLPVAWVEYLLKSRGEREASRTAPTLSLESMWTPGSPCYSVQEVLDQALVSLPDARHDTARNTLLRLSRLGEQGHSGVRQAVDRLHRTFLGARKTDPAGGSWRAEDEWDRMLPGIPAILANDGLTPDSEKRCCDPAKDTWPAITEITQEAQTPFPVDALPTGMRAAVEEVACTRMVDPAIPGAAFLAAAAGAVGGRLGVHINSSWYTRCNLYIAVVAETGDGKSPGVSPAMESLHRLEEVMQEDADTARHLASMEIPKLKERLRAEEEKVAPDPSHVMDLRRRLDEHECTLRTDPRLVVDDITPERLAELLHENDGHIVAVNDEGALFSHLLGMYSQNPNLGPFLKAWDGSRLTMDRKGGGGRERTAIVVTNPRMTMLAAVQPRVLSDLGSPRHQGLRQRGVLGRVLFVWPPSMAGRRTLRGQPHTVALTRVIEWNRHLEELALSVDQAHARFTPAAYDRFADWHDELETELPAGAAYSEVKDFVVKYREQVARIAALFALLEDESEDPAEVEVTEEHVSRATQLGDYFLQVALAVIESWQDRPVALARQLIAKIRKTDTRTFTVRDACRWTKARKDDVLLALELLEHHGHLRPANPGTGFGRLDDRTVGKKSPEIVVNPAIWEQ